jgi:hypothetical protein
MTAFADLQQQIAGLVPVKGIMPVDILQLPDPLATVVKKMMRGGMPLVELADELTLPPEQAREIGDLLVEKGFLISQERAGSGEVVYKVYFARMRRRDIAIDL